MVHRTLASSCLFLLIACGQEAPADAPKPPAETKAPAATPAVTPPGQLPPGQLPPGDPHAAPPPGEETEVPLMESAPGTFDLTVDGKLAHFVRIPRGQNRAVALRENDVSRVSVAAAADDRGRPHVRLMIDGFRPDRAEYPLTLSSPASKGAPSLSIRYQVNDNRIYTLDHAKGADAVLTLEGYEGAVLRGSFEGKLAPTAAGLGDPIAVAGKFSVELGLRNVAPGPAPAKAAAPTP